MNVNTIVQKVTNCQAEIFNSMEDYIPRAMFRFTNLQLLLTALQTDASTVQDLLQIDVLNDGIGNSEAELLAWADTKIQNVITVTIADIAGTTVRSMVGVGQDCNDAAKNLYKYLYHRYS